MKWVLGLESTGILRLQQWRQSTPHHLKGIHPAPSSFMLFIHPFQGIQQLPRSTQAVPTPHLCGSACLSLLLGYWEVLRALQILLSCCQSSLLMSHPGTNSYSLPKSETWASLLPPHPWPQLINIKHGNTASLVSPEPCPHCHVSVSGHPNPSLPMTTPSCNQPPSGRHTFWNLFTFCDPFKM